ncbi:DUF2911 domain-containing protein [Aquimarina sp. AD10]|uniref:Asparagine synthetase B n=1 Tax=Aquimarina aggregata TaxID=1642818 RepID=A0A162FAP0_9FLAO|nr:MULTISPECIES: DUF2911 domain-containing protein [Aquimarina]AXT63292.1 DUF2911 domain-containing protein [Aquimarina sp. AD10]KZS40376.1 hypothetical protein AWE51_05315 [Aquimarina aggregata]RKN00695.1 DUF2911 domain-containing protein [Aquimarina sp. AD10]
MSKLLKRTIIVLISLLVIGVSTVYILRQNTKKHSPEQTITHIANDATFTIFYNRPYKKGREIFGKLIPFGEIWRTGANEATTFTTNKDIMVDGTILKAGTYTLWTIPNLKSWKVIFNSKTYNWGVNMDGTVKRDDQFDVLTIEVPTQPLLNEIEQFSIYFENANDFTILYLAWDRTAVAVPIKV